jgi:hypothetical protein
MSDEGKSHVTTRQPTGEESASYMGPPQLTGTPPGPRLGAAEQARIGLRLAESFKHLLDQPVPDRFMQLLAELERRKEGD